MARLAIKGDNKIPGEEVINILLHLGGSNVQNLSGKIEDNYYYIADDGTIVSNVYSKFDFVKDDSTIIFTLEEFLKRFPYKTQDCVKCSYDKNSRKFVIYRMYWDEQVEEVFYSLVSDDFPKKSITDVSAATLTFFDSGESESVEENVNWYKTDYIEFSDNEDWADKVELKLDNNFELLIEDNKVFVVRKMFKYPKTIIEADLEDYPVDTISLKFVQKFRQLIKLRNIYWHLSNDWKPSENETVFSITRQSNQVVIKDGEYGNTHLLEFPTLEVRDFFYKNFKDLIYECKDFI